MPSSNQSFGNATAFSERRIHFRQPVRSVSYIDLGDGNGGIILNISEGGLSVHAVTSLAEDHVPRMRFQLSNSKDWLESSGRVTWTGESRRVVGVKFLEMPETTRAKIQKWIAQESSSGESQDGPSAPSETELFAVPRTTASPSAATPIPPAPAPASPPPVAVAPNIPSLSVPEPGEFESLLPAVPPQTPRRTPFSSRPAEGRPPIPAAAYKPAPASPAPSQEPPARAPKPPSIPALGVVAPQTSRPLSAAPLSLPFSAPPAAQKRSQPWLLIALLGFLAGAALVAGSFAGRAGLRGVLAGFNAKLFAGAQPDERIAAPRSIGAAAPVSDFEVTDLSGQHRLIPFEVASSPDANRPHPAALPAHLRAAAAPADPLPPAVAPDAQPNVSSSSVIVPASDSGQPQASAADSKPGSVLRLVNPIYPKETAISEDIQGTVKIRATIAQDGTVASLQGISGPDALMDSAMNAVRQWRYAPSTLNGLPVEHMEDISIVFRLSLQLKQ